ncbi:hypothetical protein EON65_05590 [archaeon]|nr:MAG: hypothetical protein EON65_05590 [archaeon]
MSKFEGNAAIAPLQRSLHANYFLLLSHILPAHYIGLDSSKISAIYFIVVALSLLDSLNDEIMRKRFVEGIYNFQLRPENDSALLAGKFGFISGNFMTAPPDSPYTQALNNLDNARFQQGHIAMIYTALASLLTLGDDLSRVDVDSIAKGKASYTDVCFI